MLKRFAFLLPFLSSCASYSITFPHRELKVILPESGTYVPDTFSVGVLATRTGITLHHEIVYGFPDGPVERGRSPECHHLTVEVKANGRPLRRFEGCDTLLEVVGINADEDSVRVEVEMDGMRSVAEYRVVSPYFYTLKELTPSPPPQVEFPVPAYDHLRLGDYYLLVGWKDGESVLYSYRVGDSLRLLLKGKAFKLVPVGEYAVAFYLRDTLWRYALVSDTSVLQYGETVPYVSNNPQVCDRGSGVIAGESLIFADTSGRIHLRRMGETLVGSGCLDGSPYFLFYKGSSLTFIGDSTFTLPFLDVSPYFPSPFYGEDGKILLLPYHQHPDYGQYLTPYLWDGSVWRKTYFPWRPTCTTCRYSGVGCIFLPPIAFPVFSSEEGCGVCVPFPEATAEGFKVGGRYYKPVFQR